MSINLSTFLESNFQGAQGISGIQGLVGVQGLQGTQGLQGRQGIQGSTGIQGIQGNQGLQGIQGSNANVQGIQGTEGSQGIQGSQGLQGTQGTQGSQGVQGNQGIQGSDAKAQGIQGGQGLQGNQGLQGIQGSNANVQGIQGSQGIQGNQGIQGPDGSQGIFGVQGLQGTQGLQGNQGIQGIQGTAANVQGIQGTQGIQGNQGIQGPEAPVSSPLIVSDIVTLLTNDETPTSASVTNTSAKTYTVSSNSYNRVLTESEIGIQNTAGSAFSVRFDLIYAGVTKESITLQSADTGPGDLFSSFSSLKFAESFTGGGSVTISATVTSGSGTWFVNSLRVYAVDDYSFNVGPQGTQGIQGIQGTQGIQGNQGLQGRQGIQGSNANVQGIQGTQGIQGNQGLQGRQGIQGTQGTQGIQGNQGLQGLDGLFAGIGAQGIQGTQGITGAQGLQGTQGIQGSTAGTASGLDATNTTTPGTYYPVFVTNAGGATASIRTTATAFSFDAGTGNLTIGGLMSSSRLTTTAANNTADGQGQVYLNGATGNRIEFNVNGVAAPTFTTRSAGTKMVLYPSMSAASSDYALGIEGSTLWYSVPTTSQTHRWYGGTTEMMRLSGGNLTVTGTISATTLSGTHSGNGSVPIGGIIMWSGAIASIPTGWSLCNGTNGTPDLRDRFVVGGGLSYAVGATGGANSVTLTSNELPTHKHFTVANTSVVFPFDATEGVVSTYSLALSYDSGGAGSYFLVGKNSPEANHYPSSGTGGNASHENRPPYYALAYIMRIA